MATRDVFSEEESVQLRGFPEINRAELIRHFTLAAGEVFVRKFRGAANVLGDGATKPATDEDDDPDPEIALAGAACRVVSG